MPNQTTFNFSRTDFQSWQFLQVPMGLRYCTDFISPEEEAEVLQVLDGPGTELWSKLSGFHRGEAEFSTIFSTGEEGV